MSRRIDIILLIASGLMLAVLLAAYIMATGELRQHYEVPATAIEVPAGEAAIAEGERLEKVRGCFWCHGPGLEGQLYFARADRGLIVVAPDLRRKIREYSSAEFARAVRHGIRPDGTSVQPAMPSFAYYNMSDADLGLIMAYIASLPQQDGLQGQFRLLPVGWFRWLAGALPPNAAELIDHTAARPDPAVDGDPTARGRYLAESICTECHGDNGRLRVPGTPDLLIGAAYTREDFFRLMRTGEPTGGRNIDYHMVDASKYRYVHLHDEEVEALYQYVRSLPTELAR